MLFTAINFRKLVLSLGQTKVIVIITVVTTVLAILLDILIAKIFGAEFIEINDLVRTFFIVFILAPLVSWYPIRLIFELDQLEKKMTSLATYDDLTGLYNRREFYKHAENLHQSAIRHKQNYAILAIDFDNFKKINDQCGHAVGDSVLREFGKKSLQKIRAGDIPSRLGGEEFAFFLPNTSLKQAESFAQRFREEIAASKVACDNESPIQYTVSIGIASSVTEPELPVIQVIKNADQALYAAKNNGRNQVAIFT